MKVYRILVALAILAFAGAAEAAFVIHFRNGKEIVARTYKEAGGQIRYWRCGGWLSVPKARIAVIENRETGERQVFNPYYSEEEIKALTVCRRHAHRTVFSSSRRRRARSTRSRSRRTSS